MSAVAIQPIQPEQQAQPLKPASMVVHVRGRVEASRRFSGKRFTRVACPAVDAYSRPDIVEIRSDAALGQRGDSVDVQCRVGGYTQRAYTARDEDGESVSITPVRLTLDLVEG